MVTLYIGDVTLLKRDELTAWPISLGAALTAGKI